jgi:hypothetical protein
MPTIFTPRFGTITERELDIAEHVFRRTIVAAGRTLRLMPHASPAELQRVMLEDPEARLLIRQDLEKAEAVCVESASGNDHFNSDMQTSGVVANQKEC